METAESSDLIQENRKLEQLFGSKTRVRLLDFLLKNPDKCFFVRELTRKLDAQINSIRRELANLEDLGIVKVVTKDTPSSETAVGIKDKKYYQLNQGFILYQELKNLFLKSQLVLEQSLVEDIANCGKVDYFILTGRFCGVANHVDLFLVGKIDKDELKAIVAEFQKTLNSEINYTAMETNDFLYRKSISDRFVTGILEKKKIIIIDHISDLEAKKEEQVASVSMIDIEVTTEE